MCDFACALSAFTGAVISAVAAELLIVFLFWSALAGAIVLGGIAGLALFNRHRDRTRRVHHFGHSMGAR